MDMINTLLTLTMTLLMVALSNLLLFSFLATLNPMPLIALVTVLPLCMSLAVTEYSSSLNR